jgi:hypothetical protein
MYASSLATILGGGKFSASLYISHTVSSRDFFALQGMDNRWYRILRPDRFDCTLGHGVKEFDETGAQSGAGKCQLPMDTRQKR